MYFGTYTETANSDTKINLSTYLTMPLYCAILICSQGKRGEVENEMPGVLRNNG